MLFKETKISEAQIQAECYRRLRNLGIEVYLEYKHRNCRFDLVVVENGEIVVIVEIKNHQRHYDPARTFKTKQFKKYSSLGIPLVYCLSWDELEKTISQILLFLRRS